MTEATNAARGRRQIKDTKIKRAILSLGDRKFFAPIDISSHSHSHIHAQNISFDMTSQTKNSIFNFVFVLRKNMIKQKIISK